MSEILQSRSAVSVSIVVVEKTVAAHVLGLAVTMQRASAGDGGVTM